MRRVVRKSLLRDARVTRARANKVDKSAMTFMERLRYEVDLTFNPRTAGAKIAGRCPDTQTRPSEALSDASASARARASEGDFDIASFTAALERDVALRVEREGKQNAEIELAFASASTGSDRDDLERLMDDDARARAGKARSVLEAAAAFDDARDAAECAVADDDEVDAYGYAFSNESDDALTGRELALLCFKKYGKYHDMAIKHVKMGSGMKRWVSLNLYVGHLGQRSYPATEATYLEQLDAIAYMVTSWNQQQYTRAFFKEAKIARRGLPSTPRVDTCVTLQFSRSPTWDDELGDEFFEF